LAKRKKGRKEGRRETHRDRKWINGSQGFRERSVK
jgi:hypothetical protein